jgi:hypothetical protein
MPEGEGHGHTGELGGEALAVETRCVWSVEIRDLRTLMLHDSAPMAGSGGTHGVRGRRRRTRVAPTEVAQPTRDTARRSNPECSLQVRPGVGERLRSGSNFDDVSGCRTALRHAGPGQGHDGRRCGLRRGGYWFGCVLAKTKSRCTKGLTTAAKTGRRSPDRSANSDSCVRSATKRSCPDQRNCADQSRCPR